MNEKQHNSPFSNREAEKIILTFVKDELFPIINQMKDLSESLLNYKQDFINSFFRRELKEFTKKHATISGSFFKSYKKFTTPDILFASTNKNDPTIMLDYFKFTNVVEKEINEGFKLLEIIDRQIDRKTNFAYQYATTVISLSAIGVTVVIFLFNFLP